MGHPADESPIILRRPLPYAASLQARALETIDLLVVHCTELPDLAMAREYGERVLYEGSRTGNSGHYYVDRDGGVEEWVPPERIAHHTRGFNDRSIGIELVNRGRYPDWFDSRRQHMKEPYAEPQIRSLIGLLLILQRRLPSLRWISGHESLDTETVPAADAPHLQVSRKRDPGPLFPWDPVMSAAGLRRFENSSPTLTRSD